MFQTVDGGNSAIRPYQLAINYDGATSENNVGDPTALQNESKYKQIAAGNACKMTMKASYYIDTN